MVNVSGMGFFERLAYDAGLGYVLTWRGRGGRLRHRFFGDKTTAFRGFRSVRDKGFNPQLSSAGRTVLRGR